MDCEWCNKEVEVLLPWCVKGEFAWICLKCKEEEEEKIEKRKERMLRLP